MLWTLRVNREKFEPHAEELNAAFARISALTEQNIEPMDTQTSPETDDENDDQQPVLFAGLSQIPITFLTYSIVGQKAL